MKEVNWNNLNEFKEEAKDIFWLYYDMITNYAGFGHNVDYETINTMKCIHCWSEDEVFHDFCILLHQGGMVALLCEIINQLDEETRYPGTLNKVQKVLSYQSLPEGDRKILERAEIVLHEESRYDWELSKHGQMFRKSVQHIYQAYVLQGLRNLADEGESVSS